MATVTGAFTDLPTPPYSHPQEYEALVEAMVQELYRLNPEWVERKQRLQEVRDPPLMPRWELYSSSFRGVRSKRSVRRETRSISSFGVLHWHRDEYLDTIPY